MNRKTAGDIKSMEKAGRMAAETLRFVEKYLKAGITTNEINDLAHDFILRNSAIPACLNYHGFPRSVCTSVNHVICHGVPDDTALKDGDLINVDVTCIVNGFHGDHSRSFLIGNVSPEVKKICRVAEEAMWKGIEILKPKVTTGDIGYRIDKFTQKEGYFVVRELGGHGIGRNFHEEPFIPSFGKKGKGFPLAPWCAITIEPMINQTEAPIKEIDIPGSSIKVYETGDGSLSAQFEHTVLITDTGYEVLTQV
ncbi:MAG: type I methionyl aminopeptidase [Bradymonadales bacterium]|nr:MAG: type I methionyl aminopeptidase [Bradymonadales bacterium]